jgi:transcriptional regulator GlxA family with amidase domain
MLEAIPARPMPVNLRNVAILIFDDVEVLDFAGPFEVFSVAANVLEKKPYPAFYVYTVGLSSSTVISSGGLRVVPHFSCDNAPDADILIIPGGLGTRRLLRNQAVLSWIQRQSARSELVASVCTGALLLAAAGLLRAQSATTHHNAFQELAALEPLCTLVRSERFVASSDKRLWTAGGISAGIDMSLAIVSYLTQDDMPVRTEMEWQWHQCS